MHSRDYRNFSSLYRYQGSCKLRLRTMQNLNCHLCTYSKVVQNVRYKIKIVLSYYMAFFFIHSCALTCYKEERYNWTQLLLDL